LADCTDCEEKEFKTQIVTYSQPAWKEHVRASTDTTKKPDSQQLHSTIIVGTTNVVTHGGEIPEEEDATTGEGIETVKPTTKGYTTQEWRSTAQGSTTKVIPMTTKVVPKEYTTRVVSGSPTAGETSTYNQITTKLINSTEIRLILTEEKNTMEPEKTTEPAQGTDAAHNSAMFSPLYTGPFEVTPSKGPATEVLTTDNDVATEKSTTETEIVTIEAETVATESEIIITEAVTTEAETATTEPGVVITKARVFTTELITSEPDVASTPDKTEVVVLPGDPNDNEGDQDDWDEEDNDVDSSKSADPEYCIDHEICYNGGESVCENGGDFLYCICQHGFTGTYCEQERSVAKVDDVPRGQSSFWDWKLSKYIIGGLGALTVIGLIMLTCMVVVKVREVGKGGPKKNGGLQCGGDGNVYTACPRGADHLEGCRHGQRLF